MKIPKSIKKQYKELRDPILKKIEDEQEWQIELRERSRKSTDDVELARFKSLLEESIKRCKVLMDSLEDYDRVNKSKSKISWDTILVVMGNLAGILLVLNFERLDIIRSKAFGMIVKGKL